MAAAAITKMLADDARNSKLIPLAGSIAPLIELLRSGTAAAKRNAALALARLTGKDYARDRKTQTSVAEAGAIDPLVELLRSGDPGQKEASAFALGSLAFDNPNNVLIANAGAIDPLVAMLRSGKETAASALGCLAFCNDEIKISIANAGGVDALFRWLPSKNFEVIRALRWTMSPRLNAWMINSSNMSLLVDVLDSDDGKIRKDALDVLKMFASPIHRNKDWCIHFQTALVGNGGVGYLVDLLKGRNKPEIGEKSNAADILNFLADHRAFMLKIKPHLNEIKNARDRLGKYSDAREICDRLLKKLKSWW